MYNFSTKKKKIKVEKYLTTEQRKQLEEQEAELIKKRELEKQDNWRERGLMDMMDGLQRKLNYIKLMS